jgi:hypothetical protein
MQMKRRKIVFRVLTAIAILVLAGFGISVYLTYQHFRPMAVPRMIHGDPAREAIQRRGIDLPESAHDFYFSSTGMMDPDYWMAFSVPGGEFWPAVERLTEQTRGNFTNQLSDVRLTLPKKLDPSADDQGWRIGEIRHPLYWAESSRTTNNYGHFWILDPDNSRIFVNEASL